MEVLGLKAEPNPRGGQIDLVWTNPSGAEFRGVKILRREATYPEFPGDLGSAVLIHDEPAAATPAGAVGRFSDSGLKSETVYYYAVAAYDNTLPTPKHFPVFISALATGDYRSAATMYRNLPALYQRFDTLTPPNLPGLDPAEKQKGQLLRLMELVGPQFDLLRSFAAAGRDFWSVDRVDGELLQLLADWIGWDTLFNLSLAKQRNEIKYAPHFYRTTGIAANLRATLNRVTPWNAKIKEFVHNVFLSNDPEQLTIWEIERVGVPSSTPQLVTLDMAYEGRPSAVQAADGRQWLFYHARTESATLQGPEDRWHIYYKIHDQDDWLPSRRVTPAGSINKYPTAVQRPDRSFWLFWTAYENSGGRPLPQIRLAVLSGGRAARQPRLTGTAVGPFAFADGEQFRLTITNAGVSVARTVTLHQEHFQNIAQATASEVAALLNRELPGVEAAVNKDRNVLITAIADGTASSLTLPASSVATKLGLAAGAVAGTDATSAQLLSRAGPFALASGDTFSIRVDSRPIAAVVFDASNFADITQATASEVAAAINRVAPGIARDDAGRVGLTSSSAGESSLVMVMVDGSTAAPKLGFGAPLPAATPQPLDDCEPSAFLEGGNVWLFWSSRRGGRWNLWYNRFNGANWGVARQLTSGNEADREPSAIFDTAGRIWVFWSRKKANGLWNVFARTTTDLNFPVADVNWTERELAPVPADYENKEPAAVVTAANTAELYFSSSITDGWHIRSAVVTPAVQAPDQAVTPGQFSHRTPAVLRVGTVTHLWFRNNESRQYTSPLYPAAKTVDLRYAGSTTADSANTVKIGNREKFADVQRYTYDTAIDKEDWYARDTIGIFLSANTSDPKVIESASLLIESAVTQFLPIQVRVVLVISGLAGFRFLRTWKAGTTSGVLPDLKVVPPDLSFRLFLPGATEGA